MLLCLTNVKFHSQILSLRVYLNIWHLHDLTDTSKSIELSDSQDADNQLLFSKLRLFTAYTAVSATCYWNYISRYFNILSNIVFHLYLGLSSSFFM